YVQNGVCHRATRSRAENAAGGFHAALGDANRSNPCSFYAHRRGKHWLSRAEPEPRRNGCIARLSRLGDGLRAPFVFAHRPLRGVLETANVLLALVTIGR